MIFVGIDPGVTGQIAVHDVEDYNWQFYPAAPGELQVIIDSAPHKRFFAVIERLHAFSIGGKVANFELGYHYGEMKGALKVLGIPFIEVPPMTWKKTILVGVDWKKDKMATVRYVQNRLPQINLLPTEKRKNPDHNRADAVCLALYGMEKNGGKQ